VFSAPLSEFIPSEFVPETDESVAENHLFQDEVLPEVEFAEKTEDEGPAAAWGVSSKAGFGANVGFLQAYCQLALDDAKSMQNIQSNALVHFITEFGKKPKKNAAVNIELYNSALQDTVEMFHSGFGKYLMKYLDASVKKTKNTLLIPYGPLKIGLNSKVLGLDSQPVYFTKLAVRSIKLANRFEKLMSAPEPKNPATCCKDKIPICLACQSGETVEQFCIRQPSICAGDIDDDDEDTDDDIPADKSITDGSYSSSSSKAEETYSSSAPDLTKEMKEMKECEDNWEWVGGGKTCEDVTAAWCVKHGDTVFPDSQGTVANKACCACKVSVTPEAEKCYDHPGWASDIETCATVTEDWCQENGDLTFPGHGCSKDGSDCITANKACCMCKDGTDPNRGKEAPETSYSSQSSYSSPSSYASSE
jgi:hypothetical protein